MNEKRNMTTSNPYKRKYSSTIVNPYISNKVSKTSNVSAGPVSHLLQNTAASTLKRNHSLQSSVDGINHTRDKTISFKTPHQKEPERQYSGSIKNPYLKKSKPGTSHNITTFVSPNISTEGTLKNNDTEVGETFSYQAARTPNNNSKNTSGAQYSTRKGSFDYGISWQDGFPTPRQAKSMQTKNTANENCVTKVNGRPYTNFSSSANKVGRPRAIVTVKSPFERRKLGMVTPSKFLEQCKSQMPSSFRTAKKQFLVDALENFFSLQKNTASSSEQKNDFIQIQGVAISGIDDAASFELDDGTAKIKAVLRKNDTSSSMDHNLLSRLGLSPLRSIEKGCRIDCKGTIQRQPPSTENIIFLIDSYSFCTDPNSETLHTAQIIHDTHSSQSDTCKSIIEEVFENQLIFKRDKTNGIIVNEKRILELIHLSKPLGLSSNDLSHLCNVRLKEEAAALENSLAFLQSSFEVFLSREGKFVPM